MKRFLNLILILCIILTISGCAERPTRDDEENTTTSTKTVQTTTEEPEATVQPDESPTTTTTVEETQEISSNRVGLEFIGMEIGPTTQLPEGIQDMGGWLASEDLQYAYAILDWNGQTMIWLEEFIKHDADGNAYFRVLDVLIVPMEPDTSVVGMMVKNDVVDMATFGIAVYTDTPYLEDVRRVWTIDKDTNTIIEIPADGWQAINEGYGV